MTLKSQHQASTVTVFLQVCNLAFATLAALGRMLMQQARTSAHQHLHCRAAPLQKLASLLQLLKTAARQLHISPLPLQQQEP